MKTLGQLIATGKCLAGYTLIVALLCIPGIAIPDIDVDLNTDVEGSADPGFLQRFPYSRIVTFESTGDIVSHEVIYGSLKKINRELRPERSMLTEGKVTRITYRVPDGVRSEKVIEHYRKQIAPKGDIMFSCQRRGCGSSVYWANNIFGKGLLYGPEEYQNLLVARISQENQKYFISVYAIQRGNQDGYVYLEIVEAADLKEQSSAVLVEELRSFGYLTIDDIDFDSGKDQIAMTPQLNSMANMLRSHPTVRLHIVARSRRGVKLEPSLDQSAARAEMAKALLVAAGVAPERLTAHGVGILAPDAEGAINRLVLVMDED